MHAADAADAPSPLAHQPCLSCRPSAALQAKRAHPDSAMGGFTRLLDSSQPDELMDEMPTFLCGPWPDDIPKVSVDRE